MPHRKSLSLLLLMLLLTGPALLALPVTAQTDDGPAPTTSSSSEVVILTDTFDDPETGILENVPRGDDDLRTAYEDGQYEIDALPDDFSGVLGSTVGDTYGDASIAVDAVLADGSGQEPGRFISLACRVNGETEGYRFELRPLVGSVIIRKLDASGGVRLTSEQINGGEEITEPVRMELQCNGNSIIARIDGLQVATATDSDYTSGNLQIGAGVYTVNEGRVSADFDNLAVSVPTADVPAPEPTPSVDRAALMAPINQLRSQATQNPPVFGPTAGGISQVIGGSLDSKYAGVDLENFVARITFVNPDETAPARWDIGIGFRQDASGRHWRTIVRSDGTWSLAIAAEFPRATGVVPTIDLNPGATNTLELLVSNAVAYLVVNDEYTAMMDVSAWVEAGDIWAGSGFFLDYATPGVITNYTDFTIWSLDGGATTAAPVTESPTAEAVETPDASGSPVAIAPESAIDLDQQPALSAIADAALINAPIAGPTSGSVTQGLGSIDIASADVDVGNFYTTVRFSNPASADDPEHPWDFVIGFWHRGGDDQIRLVVASDGTWSIAEGTSRPIINGTVSNLALGPARGNDVELAVEDGRGYLSINGEFAGAFDIPGVPQTGDIWIASGTFPENVQEGIETPFSDWTVWSLDG